MNDIPTYVKKTETGRHLTNGVLVMPKFKVQNTFYGWKPHALCKALSFNWNMNCISQFSSKPRSCAPTPGKISFVCFTVTANTKREPGLRTGCKTQTTYKTWTADRV